MRATPIRPATTPTVRASRPPSVYAYVLLPDLLSQVWYRWQVSADWRDGPPAADASCERRATIPRSLSSSAAYKVLPMATPTWASDQTLSLAARFSITAGDDPVLLVANYPVTFEVAYDPLTFSSP